MSTMPDNVQKAFKEALAQVPQRILWKFEGIMDDIPKNVMIKSWFPQRDILCKIFIYLKLIFFIIAITLTYCFFFFFLVHPNIKLFISHGGISGIYETVDAGVPVLGFPLFYDQHRNIANLVDAGMAISMDLLSVTKDTFLNSILELINNEK
jgi:glucuronosyltransferase